VPLSTADLLALLAAIPFAALGGEFFLKGVLGVASLWRLPKLLVATSLAAFATSSPELTVSTIAAIAGTPEIGLGDALGSNVVNVALILGLALLFGALPAHLNELRRDFIFALAVPILILIFATDGMLSRTDGGFLLMLFMFWLALIVRQAIKHRRDTTKGDTESPGKPIRAWLFLLVGLMCLLLAGHLFVTGASGIAAAMGMHNYVIGATVVAIGTSLPELVTTLLSRWRGHADLGLGILLGSNLFNSLVIVGIAAVIHPIQAPPREVSVALVVGVLTVLLILPRNGAISRQRGFCLLAAYMTYVVATLQLT
jgi:cation:H+ antiporter